MSTPIPIFLDDKVAVVATRGPAARENVAAPGPQMDRLVVWSAR